MLDQKSSKLLSVIGPTAVGKTSFVFKLIDYLESQGNHFEGYDIVSADSRQVYKDIAVISGADVPEEFVQKKNVWQKNNISLHGVGILSYQDDWSVSQFKEFAREIILTAWQSGRLPVIVGGTGLYHEHLFNMSPTLDIRPDSKLRAKLEKMSVEDLQGYLGNIDHVKLSSMNKSDRNNPVRLIRAIEILTKQKSSNKVSADSKDKQWKTDFESKTIGLTNDLEKIKDKIKKRVEERFEEGAIQEVEHLNDLCEQYGKNKQLLTATGVKEIMAYLDGEISKEVCLENWSRREFQYAKRQFTWWRKRPGIEWFDISDQDWSEKAVLEARSFLLY